MKILNPYSGSVLKEVKEDTPESISDKFKKSKLAQSCWRLTPADKRAEKIQTFKELLLSRTEDLAKILSNETGKPITQASNELKATADRIQYFCDNLKSTLEIESVQNAPKNMSELISYEPLGVVANISAWNYPYFVGSNVFIPALLTGNTVLYKPSEFSTLTGIAISELMKEAGISEDVFTIIIGGANAGIELLKQDINGLFFTGSYATGKKIASAASEKLIKIQLELGGKDPIYVCEDVDLDKATESLADGAFYNNGQSCCSVERIYVHESIYPQFVEKFVTTVKGFKIGDPSDPSTYIGPLTRPQQLNFLSAQCDDALKKGAKLHCGGKPSSLGHQIFEPTVFSNVNHQMNLMREESFGPIIGIQSVSNDDDAISKMNDTPYGLTSGVYTNDQSRAEKILAQLNSGTVYWNCCDRVSPRLPWSGRGHSGLGSTLSWHGIMAFVQPKAWHLRK
jgi:acyl-CoA reductase-like NAD-dependent aldehyde dehydrogenase